MSTNITRKQLQAFVEVAKHQNFALAAKHLYMSQPALSISVKKLEREIGGPLFNRSTRHIELTPEGRVFLPVARRLLRDWDEAFHDMHELFALKKGKLTVAAMPSFASGKLPDYLADFHRDYANIKVTVIDEVMERVFECVQQGRAELGFAFEMENMQQVDFMTLFEDRFMAILPESHPLTAEKGVTWQQIGQAPFVAMNSGSSLRGWCDSEGLKQGIKLSYVAEAGQLATVGHLVASGLGLSVVPALCQAQMNLPGVVHKPILNGDLIKKVGVIKRRGTTLSAAAEQLIQQVRAK